MSHKIIRSADFTATRAWGGLDITEMNGISVRLHWTDEPYKWHINDGEEVFAVMDGVVEMHYKERGEAKSVLLETGDIFSTPASAPNTSPTHKAKHGFW